MTIFYIFPCRSPWCTLFLRQPTVSGWKLACKIGNIQFFSRFFKFWKSPNLMQLRGQFTTLWQRLQNFFYIPRRTSRKDEEFGHLRFFIFKLLSHKLLTDRWGDFQFCLENWNFENLRKTTKFKANFWT